MSSRREDVNLEFVLKDPKCAREWVNAYDWGTPEKPTFLILDPGTEWEHTIHFEKMTDEESVLAAQHIFRHYELLRVQAEMNLVMYLN